MKSKSSTCFFTMALAVWLALVSYGVGFMWHYQGTPGLQGHPPSQWPEDSRIKSIPQLPTLVLAIHPHCPCSRATIGELAILMTHVQGLVNANVLFVKPQGFSEDWEKTRKLRARSCSTTLMDNCFSAGALRLPVDTQEITQGAGPSCRC